jgi:2-amino-4-hydroxy-6-hydroxymethyldihydropteridine diphosphokinase
MPWDRGQFIPPDARAVQWSSVLNVISDLQAAPAPQTRAWVSGGSNLDARRNLLRAACELRSRYPGARFSRCYRNAAVGFEGPDFINFVAELPCHENEPESLRRELQRIEHLCGRPADAPRWAPRAMDLDILLFGTQVRDDPGLKLPRPDLLRWAFMLGPLAELAPQLLHPVQGQTIGALWEQFDQQAHPLERIDLDLNAA